MERKEFFELIAKDYNTEKTILLEDLKQTITVIMPVFGELQTEIIETNDGKHISFIDKKEADFVYSSVDYTPTNEDLDMSCSLFSLSINKDGIIQVIEHGFNLFTPANKDNVLFLGSLIGKKTLF